jgi:hypothetical protein
MFRKRKRKDNTGNTPRPDTPPSTPAADPSKHSPGAAGVCRETKTAPLLTDAFRSAFEKAADRAKSELASKGKIGPMVFFVHADGRIKPASLLLRGEDQKDALIRRIREKVSAENVFAVMVLTEMDNNKQRGMVLSGVTLGAQVSARVDYSFDKDAKTITSWKLSWFDQPVRNVFLQGIFDKSR